MKYIFTALLATFLFGAHTASAAEAVALTVTYKVAPGTGPQIGELGLSQKEVFDIAKTALENKGWKVVSSTSDAMGGAEARIDINATQNVGGGSIFGFAVSLGMFGISNGTSAVTNGKRVAFNYGNVLVSYGGNYGFALQNTRNEVAASINRWIASTF